MSPWEPSDPPSPMLVRAADRLYAECDRAIREHRLDARSPIADAALDYREVRDEAAREADEGVLLPNPMKAWGADKTLQTFEP